MTAPLIAPMAAAVTPSTNGDDARALAVLLEVRGREDREKIAGQKGAQGGDGGAFEAADQEADEADRDHHRPGRDHRDGDGVDELFFAQPVVFLPPSSSNPSRRTAASRAR